MSDSIKQARQLRLLNELSTRLQSLLACENFYQEVTDLIQHKFNYYCVHIWSVDPDRVATLRAQAGAYREYLKLGHTLRQGEGILGHVIRTKRSYLSNDVSKDPNFTSLSIPVATRSELSVPVMSQEGQLLAVVNIESDQAAAFDEEDVLTLEAIASQISVALVNKRLFEEAKTFNDTLKTTVDEQTAELRVAQERILEQQQLLQKENKALKALVIQEGKSMEIVGNSPAIANILTMVEKIAPTMATVLIQGESGTGKELIARQLHFKSDRANGAYVVVNCGALQESLLESELFGHEKGSFTGAVTQKIGLAETADGGTLFLDEIGEMSLTIQAKLLRFLQEGEFYRIGGKKPINVNVRVISATNRDLEQEVKNSRFREDLFYRLNTITLRMPPLRKRADDIPTLVEHFLKNSRFGGAAQQIKRIDPRVMDAFIRYDWPGNIRELQNTIERLKILAENNEITLDDLPQNIRVPRARLEAQGVSMTGELPLDMSLDQVERNHILRTLAYHQGNKTRAANTLKITIKTLYNKLHRYGLINSLDNPRQSVGVND